MSKGVLGTTHRGKRKIKSEKQMKYLHAHKIDHTHYVRKKGKIIKKRHIYE